MLEVAIAIGSGTLGFLSWGLVEYLVHGVLSHRYRTFVTPLHWGHHREPRAVFTAPLAVVPAALAIAALTSLVFGLVAGIAFGLVAGIAFGLVAGIAFTAGLLAGFVRYERIHFRIHFRAPRNAHERTLRAHHLAHHFVDPRAYHGVTTHRWDRAFGTLPAGFERDYARGADRPPLEGESNLRAIWNPAHALARLRAAQQSDTPRS